MQAIIHKMVKSGAGRSANEVLRPMVLAMLALWLIGQLFILLTGQPFNQLYYHIDSWMSFHPGSYYIKYQPWSIISYAWWHKDMLSLGLNILCLYGLAQLYDERRGQGRNFFMTFVWGALWGAVFYALVAWLGTHFGLVQIFPIYGASAGVCALAFRLAMSAPRRRLRFMGLRLNFLVLVLVLYALITLLSGENFGGILAHLGGALYGITLCLWGVEAKQTVTNSNLPNNPANQELIKQKLQESGYRSLSPEEQEKL